MIENGSRWIYKKEDSRLIKKISEDFGVSEFVATILIKRGIVENSKIERFLNPDLSYLYHPFLFNGMDIAVDYIKRSITKKRKITVYGDYDVDGITSTALLVKVLRELGADVDFYIPNRLDEGYGLNNNAILELKNRGTQLIITVDCGITSFEEVKLAKSLGIDVIITDHHQCHNDVPESLAVLNPHWQLSSYPFKELAGVGVALKLAQGLGYSDWMKLLDLVAVGTIADIVPLIEENRIIVKHGLNILNNKSYNVGLNALLEMCALKKDILDVYHISYIVAPRLNAAGRIGNADLAVFLLLEEDPDKAKELAVLLDRQNRERQNIEMEIMQEAEQMIEKELDSEIFVLWSDKWHSGVIGIVASKLAERYFKPCILIALDGDEGRASARSIPNLNIFEILKECSHFFNKFGGHEQAAGFSISVDKLEDFKSSVNAVVRKKINERLLKPEIIIDVKLKSDMLNFELIKDVEKLAPFGPGNPQPLFLLSGLKVEEVKKVGKEGKHLKLKPKSDKNSFEIIGFDMGGFAEKIEQNDIIDIVCTLENNRWNDVAIIQANIRDIRHVLNRRYRKYVSEYYISFEEVIRSYYISSILEDLDPKYLRGICLEDKGDYVYHILSKNSDKKNIVIVHTLGEAIKLIAYLEKIYGKDIKKYIEIYYNNVVCNARCNNYIIINPVLSGMELNLFDNIIIYDMPFTKKQLAAFIGISRGKNLYIIFSEKDIVNNINVLRHIYPSKSDYVKIYTYLKSMAFNDEVFVSYKSVLKDLSMNLYKFDFCIKVLEEVNMLQKTDLKNGFKIKINTIPKNRINFRTSRLYSALDDFVNDFKEFLQSIKENLEGG